MSRGDIVPQSGFHLRSQPGEIRKDPVLDRFTIFAPERAGRPFIAGENAAACPFCSGHEEETLEEVEAVRDPGSPANRPGWQVRVVPNLYPAVRLHQPALGVHEVVIECPQHETSLANLSPEHLTQLIHVWRKRILAHREIPGLEYATVFRNQGPAAGASLEHLHSQVLSLGQIPTTIREELDAGRSHFARHHRCVFCDLIRHELSERHRVIEEADDFVSVAAYAGRFPFETWILPRRHRSHFEATTEGERIAFAYVLHSLLKKLQVGLCDPPFNLVLHNAPLHSGELEHYHWHVEIIPRLSQPAGFEWGTNWSVNLVPPEQAVEYLRGVGIVHGISPPR